MIKAIKRHLHPTLGIIGKELDLKWDGQLLEECYSNPSHAQANILLTQVKIYVLNVPVQLQGIDHQLRHRSSLDSTFHTY